MTRRRETPLVRRPPRTDVLSPAVVAPFVDRLQQRQRRFNTVVYVVRLLGGLAVMSWCVSDILAAGPSRPAIVPVVGLYMALTVGVFAAGGHRHGPVVWTFALLDVLLLALVYFLAQPVVLADAQVSLAILMVALLFVYALPARSRLSAILLGLGVIVTLLAAVDLPDLISGRPVATIGAALKAALLVSGVAAAGLLAYWLAESEARRFLAGSLSGLARLEAGMHIARSRRR